MGEGAGSRSSWQQETGWSSAGATSSGWQQRQRPCGSTPVARQLCTPCDAMCQTVMVRAPSCPLAPRCAARILTRSGPDEVFYILSMNTCAL